MISDGDVIYAGGCPPPLIKNGPFQGHQYVRWKKGLIFVIVGLAVLIENSMRGIKAASGTGKGK